MAILATGLAGDGGGIACLLLEKVQLCRRRMICSNVTAVQHFQVQLELTHPFVSLLKTTAIISLFKLGSRNVVSAVFI